MNERYRDTARTAASRRSERYTQQIDSRAWRRQDDEKMAWAELEDRIRVTRLMQDESQPRLAQFIARL